MKHVYLVSYDIADDKRWRRIFKVLKGYGDSVQLSVFVCVLTPEQKVSLLSDTLSIINQDQDKLLIADLGPQNGRGGERLQTFGQKMFLGASGPIII